ncbi:hypothetical protein TBLA_0D03280 [Henningerozyma blattae CBS 6284]|uniref:Major facilitator superfamily (MFS) profile domain-containing protein n=1 Tax=Henningerozyma blattae (strain ATCC 34711 / CBS 6284 / DSM 70876 / NBRC 10599 / NRRL Y-10934 / UCD 77-7) TaxID=1071380 RepID=I2H376_HENB6|nr:hypothetical protein TBLA_0D03280 [Tetrapisispora blattae CBS 6284]CCH60828.1 hypothetical protein TBLA_0D03280 [Tetrapisispora blattae CBS 6284]
MSEQNINQNLQKENTQISIISLSTAETLDIDATPESKERKDYFQLKKNYSQDSQTNTSMNEVIGSISSVSNDSDINSENLQSENKVLSPKYFKNRTHEYLFIISCMVSQFMSQAGLTQALSIMNILAEELNAEKSRQAWLMASFTLSMGSFILVSGRLGDIYGLKKVLLGGYAILTIWSLICGFSSYSHNDAFFITSRAFQGLGLAFVLPNSLGLIGVIYEPGSMKKNMIIGTLGAMSPIGATLGGLFAGIIGTKDPKQWPWSFYSFGIVSFCNMILSWYSIPNNIPTNIYNLSMDWIGAILGIFGLLILNFVFNQAPIVGWQSAYIIVLLVLSFCALVIFVVYEVKYAKTPLIPKAISSNRGMLMILFALFCGWGAFGTWTFYYFSFVLNVRGYTAAWAGGSYFIFIVSGCAIATLCGFMMKKVPPSVILYISMIGFMGGCVMLTVTPIHQSYFQNILGIMFVLPIGIDLSFPAASIILSDALPIQYQGMAGSLVYTITNYSTSICLGMAGSVEAYHNDNGQNILKGYRNAMIFADALAGLGIIVSGIYMVINLITIRENSKSTNKPKHLETYSTDAEC